MTNEKITLLTRTFEGIIAPVIDGMNQIEFYDLVTNMDESSIIREDILSLT